MRRSSLGLVFIALNVSLALVAVAGVAGAAAALFRRFTDAQAFDRVRLASVSAERGIAAEGEALAELTRVMAGSLRRDGPSPRSSGFVVAGGLSSVIVARESPLLGNAAWAVSASTSGALQLTSAAPLVGRRRDSSRP